MAATGRGKHSEFRFRVQGLIFALGLEVATVAGAEIASPACLGTSGICQRATVKP